MKVRHAMTWIPVIGIYFGLKYGIDDESPVQTSTFPNALVHAIGASILIVYLAVWIANVIK